MAPSGIASAGSSAAHQAPSSIGQHKHGGHRQHSLTDVGSAGSSAASTKSATGKLGNKVNITV
jgi:hypothetical protein